MLEQVMMVLVLSLLNLMAISILTGHYEQFMRRFALYRHSEQVSSPRSRRLGHWFMRLWAATVLALTALIVLGAIAGVMEIG